MVATDTLVILGPDHLGALAVTALATAALCVALRRSGDSRWVRPVICRGLALLLIGSAITGQAYQAALGSWTIDKSLPLHLCNLATFVAAIALYLAARSEQQAAPARPAGRAAEKPAGPTQIMYELTYYWGIGGTTQAMLTPEIEETFPSVPFLVFFTTHGGIMAAALMLTTGLRMRPAADSLPRVWLITFVTGVAVFCFNQAAGTNYMYLSGPPDRASLYDYFGPWPWSLLSLAVVGTCVFGACYLPFWLADRARRELSGSRLENAR